MKKNINLTQEEFEQAIYEAVQAERKRAFEENKNVELDIPPIKKLGIFNIMKKYDWMKFEASLEYLVADISYACHRIEELEEKIRLYEQAYEESKKPSIDELIAEAKVDCAEENFHRAKENFEALFKKKYQSKEQEDER